MIELGLAEAARLMDATFDGPDRSFRGCGSDTRTLDPDALFIAIKGERVDGHDFLSKAAGRGAAGAVVEGARVAREGTGGGGGGAVDLPLLRVDDSIRALGRLAGGWRQRHQTMVAAITGSNGKTTVKEMVSAIARSSGEAVLATPGNRNNEIGMPLTLTELNASHRYVVLEMGANHPGEIARLAAIGQPEVGVITLCSPSHLEGFATVEGVARAKGELFEALPHGGTAVINAADEYAPLWRELASHCTVITFAVDAAADVQATWRATSSGSKLQLRLFDTELQVSLALPGRHNVANACAAAAVASAMGLTPEHVVQGLGEVQAVKGRLQILPVRPGLKLLDDTYNANPHSLGAALEVLGSLAGQRWLVLGDMGELGEQAHRYHVMAAELAVSNGIQRLFTFGGLSQATTVRFADLGAGVGSHFDSKTQLLNEVRSAVKKELTRASEGGLNVLVKGSRTMAMEQVVQALLELKDAT